MGMEQKRAENIRKQFLDMLDNASNNLYNGNRGRNFEDVNYDKTSEEKYSRDVECSEYLELKRENKHLKEVQSIDVLYAVNEKITALFLKNKRLFFALLEADCLSDKPFVYIFNHHTKLIKYIVVL